MRWNVSRFKKNLENAVKILDREAVAALCEQLINHLSQRVRPYDKEQAIDILNLLRKKRMFALMQSVADALIQSGQDAFEIRGQYAQSMINQGNFTAAIAVLDTLISETEDHPSAEAKRENAEARGLKGRLHKQLFINAKDRTTKRNQEHLRQAVRWYYDVYAPDSEKHYWHGINVVALLLLARREGIEMGAYPDPKKIAQDILKIIKRMKNKAGKWEFATAVEACVALGKPKEAELWLGKYVKVQHENTKQYADAFELGSTLRQFEEIWQLDLTSRMGKRILSVLRAELLRREGGRVLLSAEDLSPQNKDPFPDKKRYEANFGSASFELYEALRVGMARARAVARIKRKNGLHQGTGFLVRGTELSQKYGEEFVLLTNAHVISDDSVVRDWYGALDPSEAVISFEALGSKTYQVKDFLWTSPPEKLDASILRLDGQVKRTDLYPLAKVLPVINREARVYVIGHPSGRDLSYSIQDNSLLNHRDALGVMHYRAPTERGSSGSPIFNISWDLVGLHHAGSPTRGFNEMMGHQEVNEGIWIRAIIKELGKASKKHSRRTQKKTRKTSPKRKNKG